MKIRFLTKAQHRLIKDIQKNHPILTFHNVGYEYIDKKKLTGSDVVAITVLERLLNKKIVGFTKFNNFRVHPTKGIELRFQYNWGAEDNSMPFTGVGYIFLTELRKGFKETN